MSWWTPAWRMCVPSSPLPLRPRPPHPTTTQIERHSQEVQLDEHRASSDRRQSSAGHAGFLALAMVLLVADAATLGVFSYTLASQGHSVLMLFAFETALLVLTLFLTLYRYSLFVVGKRVEAASGGDWHNRNLYLMYGKLMVNTTKLLVLVLYFISLLTFYGMPFLMVRDLWRAFDSVHREASNLQATWRLRREVSQRFFRPTAEEVEEVGALDPIYHTPLTPEGALKLPCGHILNEAGLMSWWERQRNCPVCRYDISQADPPEYIRERNARQGRGRGAGRDEEAARLARLERTRARAARRAAAVAEEAGGTPSSDEEVPTPTLRRRGGAAAGGAAGDIAAPPAASAPPAPTRNEKVRAKAAKTDKATKRSKDGKKSKRSKDGKGSKKSKKSRRRRPSTSSSSEEDRGRYAPHGYYMQHPGMSPQGWHGPPMGYPPYGMMPPPGYQPVPFGYPGYAPPPGPSMPSHPSWPHGAVQYPEGASRPPPGALPTYPPWAAAYGPGSPWSPPPTAGSLTPPAVGGPVPLAQPTVNSGEAAELTQQYSGLLTRYAELQAAERSPAPERSPALQPSAQVASVAAAAAALADPASPTMTDTPDKAAETKLLADSPRGLVEEAAGAAAPPGSSEGNEELDQAGAAKELLTATHSSTPAASSGASSPPAAPGTSDSVMEAMEELRRLRHERYLATIAGGKTNSGSGEEQGDVAAEEEA